MEGDRQRVEGIAALGNHVLLILDELGKAKPEVVAQAAGMVLEP